ncbi:MAG: DMT family transporter [Ignavibacteriales bacterium]|nr:DMT family transporter [Ignavibacteriales bacterium]
MNLKSFGYSISAVLLWATVATAFKLTLAGMNFLQMLFYSSLSSSVVLFIILLSTNGRNSFKFLTFADLKKSLLLGLLNPFLYYFVLFKAYSLLPAHEAQPLNYTWPIAISIMSAIFLKEKISIRIVIGLITAFVGVIIIATRGNIFNLHFDSWEGVILAIGSSIIWASFWLLNMIDKRDSSVKLFGAFFIGTILSGMYILVFDTFIIHEPKYIFGAVYIGFFEMGFTFLLWMKGLSLSKSRAKTSTLAYLSPFLSFILISVVLKEQIPVNAIIGLVFIVGGIIYQQLEAFGKNFDKKVP